MPGTTNNDISSLAVVLKVRSLVKGISITWELARKANSWALSQTY